MHPEIYIKAYNHIKEAHNILIVAHDRPDPDALASMCALMELFNILNKKFTAFCHDLPPSQFKWLPNIDKITNDRKAFDFKDFDLIIALDCGSLNRTNLSAEIKNKNEKQFIIEFDHHPKVDNYSDLEVRDPAKSATAEILYWLFKFNKIKITKNVANSLLTGLLGDTGNFIYPSTSNQTMQIASELLSSGARFPKVYEGTWRNKSLDAMKLWGKAIANLEINKKYNIAVTLLSYEDLNSSQASDEEMEGIAGFLSNLDSVNGLIMLREDSPGLIRGSLRTARHDVNIAHLAGFLGGGGHQKAAGFKLQGQIQKTDKGYEII